MQKLQSAALASLITASFVSILSSTDSSEHAVKPSAPSAGVHENLQVLPKDIGRGQLGNIMLEFLADLGLSRRAGAGCLHCHAGSLDVPRDEWDYASDEKPAKRTARVMLSMVRSINETHLSKLEQRGESALEVTCATCHAGRLNPAPLHDLLLSRYAAGGIDALEASFGELRAEYYAADAYDFRTSTLIAIGNELEARGALEDAIRVHRLNAAHSDDPAAGAGEILVLMQEALAADGIEAMVEAYHALKEDHPAEAFHPGLLPELGWKLFRGTARPAGFRLFELNYAEHPLSFSGTENLAYGCQSMGDHARALKLATDWLAAHPNHEHGRQLLAELQR